MIVHELTRIPATLDLRHFDRDFGLTNRLGPNGTDICSRRRGAAGWAGSWRKTMACGRTHGPRRAREDEEDPLDPSPARSMRDRLRDTSPESRRCSAPTGPRGSSCATARSTGRPHRWRPGPEQVELVRRRKFPLVGDGGGVWSFIHVADAAEATVAAIEHGSPGVSTWSTMIPPRLPSGCRPGSGAGRQDADAGAAVHRSAVRRTGWRGDDDRAPGASTRRPSASWRGARRIRAGGRASWRHDHRERSCPVASAGA